MTSTVGIIANPVSGLDVRRLAARARRESPQDKQNQIARAVVGAAAAGAKRFVLVRDVFRISQSAVENIKVGADFDFLDIGRLDTKPTDTERAVRAMRDAGADALLVLGGDGTNRVVARSWPEAARLSKGPPFLTAISPGQSCPVAAGRFRVPHWKDQN